MEVVKELCTLKLTPESNLLHLVFSIIKHHHSIHVRYGNKKLENRTSENLWSTLWAQHQLVIFL